MNITHKYGKRMASLRHFEERKKLNKSKFLRKNLGIVFARKNAVTKKSGK